MSLLTAAFDRLVTRINAARGSSPTLTIGAITATDILVSDNPIDPQIFDGATCDPDGPQISTKVSSWATLPVKNDTAVIAASSGADGTYDVMDTNIHDGMIYLKLGKRAGL